MKTLAFAALCTSLLAPAMSEASFVLTIQQSGNDVLASGSGTLDITDLSGPGEGNGGPDIIPDLGHIRIGMGAVTGIWSGVEGPSSFGTGGFAAETDLTGGPVGIGGTNGFLFIEQDYVSGTFFSSSGTFANATIDSLGLIPGSYVYTWGSGADADSFTIDILAPAAVPEPCSMALILAGGAVGLVARRLCHRDGSPRRDH